MTAPGSNFELLTASFRDVQEEFDRLNRLLGERTAERDLAQAEKNEINADRVRLVQEKDQLRYERQLLAACRMVCDQLSVNGNTPEELRRVAEDLAQRIVDEIGHSVTDEPALGPSLREGIAQLEESLAEANNDRGYLNGELGRAERTRDSHASRIERLVKERDELKARLTEANRLQRQVVTDLRQVEGQRNAALDRVEQLERQVAAMEEAGPDRPVEALLDTANRLAAEAARLVAIIGGKQ